MLGSKKDNIGGVRENGEAFNEISHFQKLIFFFLSFWSQINPLIGILKTKKYNQQI